jgi:hypothetical protein
MVYNEPQSIGKYLGRRRMNISTKAVLISFLAISIAAGIVLYPGMGNAATTRISGGASYIKIIEEPVIDFSIEFGEPGEDPFTLIGFLGSSVTSNTLEEQSDPPEDKSTKPVTSDPWLNKWLFNFLNKFSLSPIRGR